jgi:exopolysaccharide biosynthesis WecB/TagA/CpsF family protein
MKVNIFGINYSVTDYNKASDEIIDHGKAKISYGVSALAVHGLIESYNNPQLKEKVNKLDLIVPDGQPVRWAMNSLHNVGLKDRVYGPTLTLEVLKKANKEKLAIYLYGSNAETLNKFSENIKTWFGEINIVGIHADRFRDATREEDNADIEKINGSGANIVLVGRGCPRQEIWVSDHLGKINAAMMAVGAAFNFHAGTLPQAPLWMQDNGLEWLYRLIQEPKRLWKRYFFTNSQFIILFIKYKLKFTQHQ